VAEDEEGAGRSTASWSASRSVTASATAFCRDYTFAVRDETRPLVNIGKGYSGTSPDAEIAEMTPTWFEAHTIARFGVSAKVEPTVVVEVAFDVIVRSNRHQSGFSLRFPRIAALRPDKPPTRSTRSRRSGAVRGPPARRRALVTAGARQ
jgi:DNA ligase-1